MPPDPDLCVLSSSEKGALIRTLLARLDDLTKRVTTLETENAALRERLNLPPKNPQNSSTPPSQGHKANGEASNRRRGKGHPGAARALHPNPTRYRDVAATQCQHCQADVSGVPQVAVHVYDRIELPEIRPDVTRVMLHGGVCPCCARRFTAAAPDGLEPGSPFGPNLRAFVLYLRYAQSLKMFRRAGGFRESTGIVLARIAMGILMVVLAWRRKMVRR